MAQVQVYNQEGRKTSKLELADSVFGIEPNADAMHLAVVSYLANQRQGTQSTLTRSEVSGGGAKPWRQKGTGRARQGSTRSPQWTHGGIALGPKPRKYKVELNKKVRRLAMKSAFSSKVAAGEMTVVDSIKLDAIKTAVKSDFWVSVIEWLSLKNRYEDFYLGVFHFEHVIFYLTVAAVALFLTRQVIEKRRWS